MVTRLVPAAARALDILELFLGEREQLSLPEIVARTGMPRTTAFEIVGTLVTRNYLSRTASDKDRFELGFMCLRLGTAYKWRSRLVRVGQLIAEEVSAACSETVNIAVLDSSDVIYVSTVEGNHIVRIAMSIGRRLPAHCTALGKILLAGLSASELEKIYPSNFEFIARTPHTLTSFDELFKELDKVRTSGFAIERNESNDGVSCVAAPIRDESDRVVAAMSITVPSHRLTVEEEARLLAMVQQGALHISARLGSRSSQVHLTTENEIEELGSTSRFEKVFEKRETS